MTRARFLFLSFFFFYFFFFKHSYRQPVQVFLYFPKMANDLHSFTFYLLKSITITRKARIRYYAEGHKWLIIYRIRKKKNTYSRSCKQAMQKWLKNDTVFPCLALNKNCGRAPCAGSLIQGPSSRLRWLESGAGAQGCNLSGRFIVFKAVETGYAEMFEKWYRFFLSCPE